MSTQNSFFDQKIHSFCQPFPPESAVAFMNDLELKMKVFLVAFKSTAVHFEAFSCSKFHCSFVIN